MSTAVMFSSRKWRRMAMALQPQQLSSSMVTPGANRGRAGHKQHLGGWQRAQGQGPRRSSGLPHPLWNWFLQPYPLSKASPAKLHRPGPGPALILLGLSAAQDPVGLALPLETLSPFGWRHPLSWAASPSGAASSYSSSH